MSEENEIEDLQKPIPWKVQYEVINKMVEEEDRRRKAKKEENDKKAEMSKIKSQVVVEIINEKYDNENFVKKAEEYRKRKEMDPNTPGLYSQLLESRMTIKDFDLLKRLGKGGFANVLLVRYKKTGEILAMKVVNKNEKVLEGENYSISWRRKQTRLERDAMIAAIDSTFIVSLKYSFQDLRNLYFLMEFIQGGNLTLLIIERHNYPSKENFFSEKEVSFYIAELLLCVEEIHKMGFCHRDLKPDNILIDVNGHLKVTDFGICKPIRSENKIISPEEVKICRDLLLRNRKNTVDAEKMYEERNRKMLDRRYTTTNPNNDEHSSAGDVKNKYMHTFVGTDGYLAPEILLGEPYEKDCDIFSLGCVIYELFMLHPAFYDRIDYNGVNNMKEEEKRRELEKIKQRTRMYVLDHKESMYLPKDDDECLGGRAAWYPYYPDFKDFIRRMICNRDKRATIEELKRHPFMKRHFGSDEDWENLKRSMKNKNSSQRIKAPVRRNAVNSDVDCIYFDEYPEEEDKKLFHEILYGKKDDEEEEEEDEVLDSKGSKGDDDKRTGPIIAKKKFNNDEEMIFFGFTSRN